MSAFDPAFDQLPKSIPVFPLPSVLLLPRGILPLNIFEPRYLAMVDEAMASGRMIAMVQPKTNEGLDGNPPVYEVACAGRIVQFEEEADGRYLISLKGVSRLHIDSEMVVAGGFRLAQADWRAYRGDLEPWEGSIDRGTILAHLPAFMKHYGLRLDWEALESAPDEHLVTALSMICPFPIAEKQALLEANSLEERAKVLGALIDMAVADIGPNGHMPQ